MSEVEEFQAFLSYAQHDKKTDPELLEAVATRLENYVNARLTNARFVIWRDDQLHTGQNWEDRIVAEVRKCDILLLLLSPQWLQSDWCRREYCLFEMEEASRSVEGYTPEYVVPISIRSLKGRERWFSVEQAEVYGRIMNRQNVRVPTLDFATADEANRRKFVEKIADDIEGMIDRRRVLRRETTVSPQKPRRSTANKKLFESKAFDYEKVDFIRSAEIMIEPSASDGDRRIYAQVDFVERLYVQGTEATINFGIRRAFLSVWNCGPGELRKVDDFRSVGSNVRYVRLHEQPDAITLALHPEEGRDALSDLALPPAKGENYLSVVALASRDVVEDKVQAELAVFLEADSLNIEGHKSRTPSKTLQNKILAIFEVALKKDESIRQTRKLSRAVKVRQ